VPSVKFGFQDQKRSLAITGSLLVPLAATDGSMVDLSRLAGRALVYIYPRTGVPGQPPLSDDWDAIPGARGCTPQSCSFRDYFAELRELGVGQLYGLSTQDIAYQSEAVERLNLPFAILSDRNLVLTRAIELPTFEVVGMTLLKRMVPIIDTGVISKVFYPVFPPDKSAEQVIATPAARVATPPPRRRRG
jgi:peroxiredoxin